MSAETISPLTDAPHVPDAFPMHLDTPATDDSTSMNQQKSRKRKLDKQTRRAEWKEKKKLKAAAEKEEQKDEPKDGDMTIDATPRVQHGTQKRSGAVTEASVLETNYFFRDGYRMVHPYWFEFATYAKRRWIGRRIIDVLKGEYGNGGKGTDEAETESYYRRAIESGAFRIGGKKVSVDHIVREGDHFQHYQHRHETPVTDDPVVIHYEDSGIIVVHKPSSIPVHPCGNYRHNTILYILAKEHGWRNIWVIHRLDAVTSGLLILGKTPAVARRLSTDIADKIVRKQYVARVQGRVPEDWQEKVVDVPIYQHNMNGQSVMSTSPPKDIHANTTTAASGPQIATPKNLQTPESKKDSITVISFLAYDEKTNSSLVKCCPLTGRTHQIRLHLQHLGFPICNDARYGGTDSSSGQANDLAAFVDPSAAASNSSVPTHDAATYWTDTSARRQQLETETEVQRQARIESESVDRSGSCPICDQALKAQNASSSSPPVNSSDSAIAASSSTPLASPAPSSSPLDLVDADTLCSPFSSTRIRVEYIWLHAFRYEYDPTVNNIDGAASISTPQVASSASSAPPSIPSPHHWCYEIPWPTWALEIATPELRATHSQVHVVKDGEATATPIAIDPEA